MSNAILRSAIACGRIRIIEERDAKVGFFDELLAKYGTGVPGRPKSFYPRLDEVTVYALAVERITGKQPSIAPRRPKRSREMASRFASQSTRLLSDLETLFQVWAIVARARSTAPCGSCSGGLPVAAVGRPRESARRHRVARLGHQRPRARRKNLRNARLQPRAGKRLGRLQPLLGCTGGQCRGVAGE